MKGKGIEEVEMIREGEGIEQKEKGEKIKVKGQGEVIEQKDIEGKRGTEIE